MSFYILFPSHPMSGDTMPVPKDSYLLVSVISDNTSHPASAAYALPGEIIPDMGDNIL